MDKTEELSEITPIVQLNQTHPAWAGKNDVIQSVEDTRDAEAQATGFPTTVKQSFLYGSNWGVQIAKDIMRNGDDGGVDPAWTDAQRGAFITANKDQISGLNQWRYEPTGNLGEATALIKEEAAQAEAQDMLERRGGLTTMAA